MRGSQSARTTIAAAIASRGDVTEPRGESCVGPASRGGGRVRQLATRKWKSHHRLRVGVSARHAALVCRRNLAIIVAGMGAISAGVAAQALLAASARFRPVVLWRHADE